MTQAPVLVHGIRTIFAGRVFTLQVESVTLPTGRRVDAEVVRHPGCVVLIPVTERGEIVLVRQYRHAIGREAWELPAGTLEPGEPLEQAAIRECHEEIGLVPARLTPLGAFFPVPGYGDEKMHFYRADGLREPVEGESAEQDEDEDLAAQPFEPAAIRRMIAAGEIVDLKTVAGMFLVDA